MAWLFLLCEDVAQASCDQIPGTANVFRGTLGSVNRPFAGPGDFVEVRLSPVCDGASAGFSDAASDLVVTIAFTPPSGDVTLVVLAPDCASIEAQRQTCEAQGTVRNVVCRSSLTELEVFTRDEARRVRFRFPDSDDLVGPANDGRTLTGPAAIAVSHAEAPLPCGLAAQPCAAQNSLVACVDALFAIDGACDPNPHEQFTHFTALPPPNDAQALCVDPTSLCTGRAAEMRMTIDAAGNLLVPMSWEGVILPRALGIARLLNANAAVTAFPDQAALLRIPSQSFLHSFSAQGGRLAPVFEPRVDPSRADSLVLFGSTDAPQSVLWIARRSPTLQQCAGGSADGRPCASASDCDSGTCGAARCVGGSAADSACVGDADCPGSECGPSLFDFRSRLLDGVGPVILPRFASGLCQNSQAPCESDSDCPESRCVTFRIAAAEPVPLDSVIESDDLLALVVPEAIDERDLNGDGDTRDHVLLVTDRRSGARLVIGEGAAPGRAATRIHDAPFNYPAVVGEGDLIAFLEAEPAQGRGDRNGDGDEFDTFLRVFRANGAAVSEINPGIARAVDAAPAINGRSVVIENGLLWFRAREAASASQRVSRVSVRSDGGEADARSQSPALSADGMYVGFESAAANLTDTSRGTTSYVHDRTTATTAPVNVFAPNVSADSATFSPSLSGDGRYVAVSTRDVEGVSQVFAVDRDADVDGIYDEPNSVSAVQMSNKPNEVERPTDGPSLLPRITPNGRYVAFLSEASVVVDLFRPPLNVVVRDRDPWDDGVFEFDAIDPGPIGSNDTASRAGGGLPPYGEPVAAQLPAISGDGRFVAFSHFEQNVTALDVNNFCLNPGRSRTSCADILLRDRTALSLELISVSAAGVQSNNHSLSPAMSDDGRFTAYFSGGNTLVAGDTNDGSDVFVFNRLTESTVRVSVATDGTEGNGAAFDRVLSISADGRFIAFASTASNLVAGDANVVCENDFDGAADDNCRDVFLHDRLTGFTRRVSVAPDGGDADGQSGYPALSADGAIIAFESQAGNLVAGDTNIGCDNDFDGAADDNCQDIFVAEPDPADAVADLNADGDLGDELLQVLDSTTGDVRSLGPTSMVALAGNCVAFLSPESGTAPGSDLNGDGDTRDDVVQLYCHGDGAGVRNLGRAATAVALSRERVAVLVSETGQGGRDLNEDGDVGDTVVAFAPAAAPEQWTNTALAGDALSLSGPFLAFAVPELSQARSFLNGDRDRTDRVLHTVDASGAVVNTEQAVEDWVMHGARVAMRTAEAAQGEQDLSGDGNVAHAVMQLFDIETRALTNTRLTAIPCQLPSCDSRFPYRLSDDTLRFLTLESQQGTDLTGNGTVDELVLQVLNLKVVRGAGGGAGDVVLAPGAAAVIGSVRAGVCADTGDACVSAAQCSDGRACIVPPGRCVIARGTPCDLPGAFTSVMGLQRCGAGEFCAGTGQAGKGQCHAVHGPCDTDAQCGAAGRCEGAHQSFQHIGGPLSASARGDHVFIDAGRCIAQSDRSCDPNAAEPGCAFGERCAGTDGGFRCQREHGTCRRDSDCPRDSTCRPELIVATAADSDADGLADPFDNCPSAANIDQADADDNGVGDACQVAAATATVTPTLTVAATATPASPEATPTSVAADEDDGSCAISDASSASYRGTLLIAIAGLLLWIVRQRKPGKYIAFLVVIAATAAPAFGVCHGDCDGSGVVRIDELVGLVAVALSGAPPQECTTADRDANARITVNELVTAVDVTLRGCPTVPVKDTAAAAVAMLRGLSRIHGVVGAVSVALDGAGMVLECELAGEAGSTCQEVGPSVVRSITTAAGCRKPIPEGSVLLDGEAVVRGIGQCPSLIMPNGLRFDFDWEMTVADDTETPLVTSRLELRVVLESVVSGPEPCRVKGGTAQLSGDLTYLRDELADISMHFDATRAQTQLDRFTDGCNPRSIRTTLRGPVTLDAAPIGAPRVDFTNDTLLVDVDLDADAFTLTGSLRGDCFNGSARVSTIEPFDNLIGGGCFTRGALRVDNRRGTVLIRANTDGSIAIDIGADGTTDASFESCRAIPVSCVADAERPANVP